MSQPLKENKIYFENLDFLRFIAFFTVFSGHTALGTFLINRIHVEVINKFIWVFSQGGTGVSFFFVLSGFLITYLLLIEKEKTGKINVRNFYVRRILRIWPLYYLVILFTFIIYPKVKVLLNNIDPIPNNIWMHLSFLSNFDMINAERNQIVKGIKNIPVMIGINWSIAIEEQFYLVWPLLFALIPKKFYKYIFILIIFISAIFRYINRADSLITYFHTLAVFSDLAIGGFFAYLSINSETFQQFFKQIKKYQIALVYVLGLSTLMYGNFIYPNKYDIVYMRIISTTFFAFIITEQNYSEHSIYKLGKIKFVTQLGKYTYGLYLIHPIGIQAVAIILYKILKLNETQTTTQLIYICSALIVSIIIGFISYTYYETPFLKLKNKFETK